MVKNHSLIPFKLFLLKFSNQKENIKDLYRSYEIIHNNQQITNPIIVRNNLKN